MKPANIQEEIQNPEYTDKLCEDLLVWAKWAKDKLTTLQESLEKETKEGLKLSTRNQELESQLERDGLSHKSIRSERDELSRKLKDQTALTDSLHRIIKDRKTVEYLDIGQKVLVGPDGTREGKIQEIHIVGNNVYYTVSWWTDGLFNKATLDTSEITDPSDTPLPFGAN